MFLTIYVLDSFKLTGQLSSCLMAHVIILKSPEAISSAEYGLPKGGTCTKSARF